MRKTMRPPWLRTESHAIRAEKILPRCMRPEGDGAKRPATQASRGQSALSICSSLNSMSLSIEVGVRLRLLDVI